MVTPVELRDPFLKPRNELELLKGVDALRGNFLREIVEGRAREEAMTAAEMGEGDQRRTAVETKLGM